MQIAQNYETGRFYRVELRQSRYFPIAKTTAELALATGEAILVDYLPFSRPDLMIAYMYAQKALAAAAN